MTEPERVRLDPYVRDLGHAEGLDGELIHVGVDYDAVTVRTAGQVRLSPDGQGELAQLFVSAVWQAGQQKRQMAEEIHEADGGGTMAEGCVCGQTTAACAEAGREAGRG